MGEGKAGPDRQPPPPPLENRKNIAFLRNAGSGFLEKSQSYQASIQCRATIGPLANCHLNGVSLVGR